MTRRLLSGGLALLLLSGCVYYNGMYNTKRLAGSARKAERDGRTFEATSLWGQVVTRAESLVVRHPDSKYVDEALMLKGTALARLGQCPSAVPALSRVAQVTRASTDATEDAYLALGRCQLELGDPAAADLAFAHVLQSRQTTRRRDAQLLHAQALRLTGRPDEALGALEGLTSPRAMEERVLALAAAGHGDQAFATADSLLAQPDTTRTWDSLVVAVGRADPLVASRLVDRLVALPGTAAALRTRWLLEDGLRLSQRDTARADARLVQAAEAGAGTPAGAAAQVQLARRQIARAGTPADLDRAAPALDTLALESGPGGEAGQLRATIGRIRAAEDSSAARRPEADLRLFLAAEAARDSLEAPAVAAVLFRRVAEEWPDSPYAAKAVLASGMLDPKWADSAGALLTERYAASPYVAYVQGAAGPEYQALEDSLRTFALTAGRPWTPAARPGVRRPGAPETGVPETGAPEPGAPGPPRRRGLEP